MSPDNEATLRRDYSLTYSRPFLNGEGFRCDDGWLELLVHLSSRLEAAIAVEPTEDQGALAACQVKEKFGGLRFYTYAAPTPLMEVLIDAAETASFNTCEACGQPGSPRTVRSWVQTLCAPCYQRKLAQYARPGGAPMT